MHVSVKYKSVTLVWKYLKIFFLKKWFGRSDSFDLQSISVDWHYIFLLFIIIVLPMGQTVALELCFLWQRESIIFSVSLLRSYGHS